MIAVPEPVRWVFWAFVFVFLCMVIVVLITGIIIGVVKGIRAWNDKIADEPGIVSDKDLP